MGSVVKFPGRLKAFNVDEAPLTTADDLHIVGLDRHFHPVVEGGDAPWWGTIGIWKSDDLMSVRLSAAFLDYNHAKSFTEDIASAGDCMVFEGMDEDMILNIRDALYLKELEDGKQVTDEELTDFSDLEPKDDE